MNTSFEDQIRERAYHMWLATGMADGQAHDHWVSAEKAVLVEKAGETVTVAAPKPAPARKTTKVAAKPARTPKAKPAKH